jgi:pimeloyl-ACP methyl ester carboxylesterase
MDSTRRWLAPDGASIFYRHWRPASPRGALVLLHGVASNATRWWEFVADTSLKANWSLIRIDRRGQGQSVWRKPAGMREWCDDVAGILASEGFAQGIVGGHCLGANIAVEFGARYPQRAAGLVLVEPMPPRALAGPMKRTANARPLLYVLAGATRVLNAMGLHRRTLVPLDLEALDRGTRSAMSTDGNDAAQFAKYASPLLDLKTTPFGSYVRDLLAVAADLPPFEAVTVPVLALLSRHSTFTEPAQTRRTLQRFPRAEIVELETRHWIPTEQPREMREAIESWVARISGVRS